MMDILVKKNNTNEGALKKWLNRLIVALVFVNFLIASSFPGLSSTWSAISSAPGFCEINYCTIIAAVSYSVLSPVFILFALMVVAKEWFLVGLNRRILVNTALFLSTSILISLVLVAFYAPGMNSSVIQ